MTILLVVLISGMLLDSKDVPMPKSHLVFTSNEGKLVEVTTKKDGTFRVKLAPGTYRVLIGTDVGELIIVDKSTSKLKLRQRAPVPNHPIEVREGIQRGDFPLPPGPRGY